MLKVHLYQTAVEIVAFKEFPLEVKADCAIKLQLEACLGQGYKCDVSTTTSSPTYVVVNPISVIFYILGED